MPIEESTRVAELRKAQDMAAALFREIDARGMIRSGIKEGQLNEEIFALARDLFATTTHWHKRIVRAGQNTLLPYAENPPDLTIREDEILFLDLGPVFSQWESDFGRTFVLGSDPRKLKLRDDCVRAFTLGKEHYRNTTDITAQEMYAYVQALATNLGWEFGGQIAGHLIGEFPHEKISGDKVTLYIHPQSPTPLRSLDEHGRQRHWILEIHMVDRQHEIGAFYEELLTIDYKCKK